jgi:hypothetical protein
MLRAAVRAPALPRPGFRFATRRLYTIKDALSKGAINMPVSVAVALISGFFGGFSFWYVNKDDAALRQLELKALRESNLLDDMEEQRKVVYHHMADMSKPTLQFDLKPKVTKARNEAFMDDIENALRMDGIPMRVLCVPPGYGKTYTLCKLLKRLEAKGVIAGADIVRGDMAFLDSSVDLEAWLLKQFGVKEKRGPLLEGYFLKPKGASTDLPYYVVFDQLDSLRLHPFFEHFIVRLKDIALRHKNIRFLMSTHEPLVAEQIHAMNGNEKIRFGTSVAAGSPSILPRLTLLFISVRGGDDASKVEPQDASYAPR